MSSLHLPGAKWIGGRCARCVPGSVSKGYGSSGVLAEPVRYRGVTLPERSRVSIELDFADVGVELGGRTNVRGWDLPAGSRLRFFGRVLGFAGLRVPPWLAPIYFPVAWAATRRRDGDVRVEALPPGADFVLGLPPVPFVIHSDGAVERDGA
jgi:hypothetical protein